MRTGKNRGGKESGVEGEEKRGKVVKREGRRREDRKGEGKRTEKRREEGMGVGKRGEAKSGGETIEEKRGQMVRNDMH